MDFFIRTYTHTHTHTKVYFLEENFIFENEKKRNFFFYSKTEESEISRIKNRIVNSGLFKLWKKVDFDNSLIVLLI